VTGVLNSAVLGVNDSLTFGNINPQRGAADRGEYRQAAGAAAEALSELPT
jgi:hypothetical protein